MAGVTYGRTPPVPAPSCFMPAWITKTCLREKPPSNLAFPLFAVIEKWNTDTRPIHQHESLSLPPPLLSSLLPFPPLRPPPRSNVPPSRCGHRSRTPTLLRLCQRGWVVRWMPHISMGDRRPPPSPSFVPRRLSEPAPHTPKTSPLPLF